MFVSSEILEILLAFLQPKREGRLMFPMPVILKTQTCKGKVNSEATDATEELLDEPKAQENSRNQDHSKSVKEIPTS